MQAWTTPREDSKSPISDREEGADRQFVHLDGNRSEGVNLVDPQTTERTTREYML